MNPRLQALIGDARANAALSRELQETAKGAVSAARDLVAKSRQLRTARARWLRPACQRLAGTDPNALATGHSRI